MLLFSAECTIGMVWGLKALKHYSNKAVCYLTSKVQCSSDISEPKYTRNTRQPNTRIRVCIYANMRMHIRKYAYTVYARMPH